MKRQKTLKILALLGVAAVGYDNYSSPGYTQFWIESSLFGTNCDITDGALSRLSGLQYTFHWLSGKPTVLGNGWNNVELKPRSEINYGPEAYIPFYKTVEPKLIFDCYIHHGSKYIGKIALHKRYTFSGLLNRNQMENYVKKDYTETAAGILNQKSIPYQQYLRYPPFGDPGNYSESSVGPLSPKIRVGLSAPNKGFNRKIPIREIGEIYSDTIFYTPLYNEANYPLYEIYEVNKPARTLTFRSYNAMGRIIFSNTFELHTVYESGRFIDYGILENPILPD